MWNPISSFLQSRKGKAALAEQAQHKYQPKSLSDLAPGIRRELMKIAEDMAPRQLVRDLGMNSTNIREAIDILTEASPALGMYLDRFGYRTVGQGLRDISETARLAILRRAEWTITSNPIAKRAMQIRTDLVVSEGFDIVPTSKKPEYSDQIKMVVDNHWKINEWEERLSERVLDLGVTGEMIRMKPTLEAQILTGDSYKQGYFRAGLVLPHNVISLIPDPWNAERLLKMRVNIPDADGKGWRLREFDIVQQEIYGRFAGTITGEVLYTGIGRRPGASRGVSDLLAVSEHLDMHDQLLWSEAERTRNLLKHLWDVSIKGADSKKLRERSAEVAKTPPNNGTVIFHNEDEIWKPLVPGLTAAQSLGLIDAVFKIIWGGLGLPEHWFVSANTVNRASAQEMSEPVWSWARTRKGSFMSYLKLEHELAVQVAIVAGIIDVPKEERGIEVVSRDPDRTAYDVVGSTIQAMSQGLQLAVQSGFIDQANAIGIFRHVVNASGVKLDQNTPDGELAKADPAGTFATWGGQEPFERVIKEALCEWQRQVELKKIKV